MIRGKFYKCISVLILYRRRRFINHLLTYLLISPPLQRAQNEAARLILRLAPHDHVTVALRHLDWLPVQYRITYKLCLLNTYAPHSYPQGTILSQRHCHCDSIGQFSWTASIRQQFPLRAATDETQISSHTLLSGSNDKLWQNVPVAITFTRWQHTYRLSRPTQAFARWPVTTTCSFELKFPFHWSFRIEYTTHWHWLRLTLGQNGI